MSTYTLLLNFFIMIFMFFINFKNNINIIFKSFALSFFVFLVLLIGLKPNFETKIMEIEKPVKEYANLIIEVEESEKEQSFALKKNKKETLSLENQKRIFSSYYDKHSKKLFSDNNKKFTSYVDKKTYSTEEQILNFYLLNKYQISLVDFACMVENVYREAGNQQKSGQIAVNNTVINRMKRTTEDACKVIRKGRTDSKGKYIKDKCHYSWLCDHKEKDFKSIEVVKYYDSVLSSFRKDVTNGATHYHAYYVSPWWKNDKVNFVFIKRIQDHLFYVEKKYGKVLT